MQKVMLDLETMGTSPGCVVLSIGAVMFDHECPEPWVGNDAQEFHVRLDTELQHSVGLKTDPATALFWMGQSDAARRALLDMDPVDTRQALAMFADWLEGQVGEPDDEGAPLEVEVWANGANFDGPILREVYMAMGLKHPWAWWNERCYRTERKSLKRHLEATENNTADPDREGTHHDALADARHQANVLCILEKRLTHPDSL